MKLCNDTITVLNIRPDSDKDYDEYAPTIIRGVSWFCEIASNVDASGLKAANKFTIRIPEGADFSGKSYVEPSGYLDSEPSEAFTLRNGDIIVKGELDVSGLTLADILAHDGVVKVLGVTDNRRAPNAPHWKVVGS